MKPILINLDLKTNSYEDIELKQGCQDTLIATITDLGDNIDLTGQVISVEMLKGDNTFIIQTNDITVSTNKVTIKLHKDFTRVKGKTKLQIKMTKSGVISGSWVVVAWVREGAIDSAIGESGNIVTIKEELDNSIVKAGEENKKTQDLIQNGGAATKGELTEVRSDLAEIANKGTTIEVLERTTKDEIDRQVADGTIANLTIMKNSITYDKFSASTKEYISITGTKDATTGFENKYYKAYLSASNGEITYLESLGVGYYVIEYKVKENYNVVLSCQCGGSGCLKYVYLKDNKVVLMSETGNNSVNSFNLTIPPNIDTIRFSVNEATGNKLNGKLYSFDKIQDSVMKNINDIKELKYNNSIYEVNVEKDIMPIFKKNKNINFKEIKRIGEFDFDFKWVGGVMASNGKIICIPNGNTQVGEVNPENGLITLYGDLPLGEFKWTGGCTWKDGNVYGFPRSSNNILKINPFNQTTELIPMGTSYSKDHHYGGALFGDKIYCAPRNENHILCIDLNTYKVTKIGQGTIPVGYKYCGAITHYNGLIYFLPQENTRVMTLNPLTNEIAFIGNVISGWAFGVAIHEDGCMYGFTSYSQGLLKINPVTKEVIKISTDITPNVYGTKLGINGRMYGICGDGTKLYEFNPYDETVKVLATIDDGAFNEAKCAGGVLAPNGTIWGIPAKGKYFHKIIFDEIVQTLSDKVLQSVYFSNY